MPAFGTGNQGGLAFSPVRVETLNAAHYTVAGIAVDASLSVGKFKVLLEEQLGRCLGACKKSPLRDTLLLRVTQFTNTFNDDDIEEIVGFTPVMSIPDDRFKNAIKIGSMTPLNKATLNLVHSQKEQGQELLNAGFNCNGIGFILTDGIDNKSGGITAADIKAKIASIAQQEALASYVTILVGIGCGRRGGRSSEEQDIFDALTKFKEEAGITHFLPVADASEKTLAKLANFLSQSISSTSQAITTGGPSQMVAPGASLTI